MLEAGASETFHLEKVWREALVVAGGVDKTMVGASNEHMVILEALSARKSLRSLRDSGTFRSLTYHVDAAQTLTHAEVVLRRSKGDCTTPRRGACGTLRKGGSIPPI